MAGRTPEFGRTNRGVDAATDDRLGENQRLLGSRGTGRGDSLAGRRRGRANGGFAVESLGRERRACDVADAGSGRGGSVSLPRRRSADRSGPHAGCKLALGCATEQSPQGAASPPRDPGFGSQDGRQFDRKNEHHDALGLEGVAGRGRHWRANRPSAARNWPRLELAAAARLPAVPRPGRPN